MKLKSQQDGILPQHRPHPDASRKSPWYATLMDALLAQRLLLLLNILLLVRKLEDCLPGRNMAKYNTGPGDGAGRKYDVG